MAWACCNLLMIDQLRQLVDMNVLMLTTDGTASFGRLAATSNANVWRLVQPVGVTFPDGFRNGVIFRPANPTLWNPMLVAQILFDVCDVAFILWGSFLNAPLFLQELTADTGEAPATVGCIDPCTGMTIGVPPTAAATAPGFCSWGFVNYGFGPVGSFMCGPGATTGAAAAEPAAGMTGPVCCPPGMAAGMYGPGPGVMEPAGNAFAPYMGPAAPTVGPCVGTTPGTGVGIGNWGIRDDEETAQDQAADESTTRQAVTAYCILAAELRQYIVRNIALVTVGGWTVSGQLGQVLGNALALVTPATAEIPGTTTAGAISISGPAIPWGGLLQVPGSISAWCNLQFLVKFLQP